MKLRALISWSTAMLILVVIVGMLVPPVWSGPAGRPNRPADVAPHAESADESGIRGPIILGPVEPYVFDGDLRDLPQLGDRPIDRLREVARPDLPLRLPAAGRSWEDPVAQRDPGSGHMPGPIANFEGLDRGEGGGWIPPDPNGDVGIDHYVQNVNIGIGIYDKATGAELVVISFDDFFDGTGTPCDYSNRGDPIVLYDQMADRWIITDFSLPSSGPVYECIAVSQSGDPISGGWYFYALVTDEDGSPWHDYPKLSVWPDAYYMSANMFDPAVGAWVWALDRAAMLIGDPLTAVRFENINHWSLLPANLKGPLPPAGSPNYFVTVEFPDQFLIWEFHVDWANPGDSTFTGPVALTVPEFGIVSGIPQRPPGATLASLGDRPMMQLQYRNFGPHESLWVNHTVASGGVAGVRWYEVRDPGGTPFLYQAGTYQPEDGLYRWMGSLAVDQDGNMALGYSTSSESTSPGIRYTGRLAGEVPGQLLQGEALLFQGPGVQVGSSRWGDYSAMTVDPTDDCTFWYTHEYHESDGSAWTTRIGSFRFPSCGQPKGWITGMVYDADSLVGIPGVLVVAEGLTTTMTVQTDAGGYYTLTLPGATYTLTAGPLPPAYPNPTTVPGVLVTAGITTNVDIPLSPAPYLVEEGQIVDDNVPGGNNNGFPEPGESGLLLWESISNTGATTATNVTAHLVALTPGVTVTIADAAYPDIAPGTAETNLTAFEFSIDPAVPCGSPLDFQKVVTADQGTYTLTFRLYAKTRLPRQTFFFDDMEHGQDGWVTGGTPDSWAITEEQSHSPTHAWSDSPYGNYTDNASNWLRSPVLDLSDLAEVELHFWHRYEIETGWDFGYLEYSLDGGATWQTPVADYTGFLTAWTEEVHDARVFDDQPNVAFRFRFESDAYVNEDGWYIDDVQLTYEPYICVALPPDVPTLISPPDGTVTNTAVVTFTWQPGGGGDVQGYNLDLDGQVYTVTEPVAVMTLSGGLHIWRVRAYNAAGDSAYTAPWSVTVVVPPTVPLLLSPPDGTVTTSTVLTFTWQAGNGGGQPDGYHLDLDGQVYTVTEPVAVMTLSGGLHIWRVRAYNAAGISDYSAPWSVTVTTAYRVFLPLVMRGY